MKDIILGIVAALSIAAAIVMVTILLSCKTFTPIWIDKLPPECNMSLNAIKLYYGSTDKSGAVPSMILCYKCLARTACKKEIFGDGPVDYNNASKIRDYNQCLTELQ